MSDAAATDTGQSQGRQPAAAKAGLLSTAEPETTTTPTTTDTKPNGNGAGNGHAPAANDDWRTSFAKGLDEDTAKTWGSLSSRYTSPTDMAKAHVSLVKTMDQRIPIPANDAKPEEWDQVYNKLGRPESADKYQFEFPEDAPWDDGQKEHIKGLAPLFHKNGATQRQVNEFVRQQAELDKVARDAAIAKANTLNQQRDRQMRTEWPGEDYKRNRNMAATFVKTYAGADVEEAASMRLDDGTFALDHPVMQRMLAKAAAERSEDDRDPTAFNTGLRASAKSEIERIEGELKEKGLSPSDPQWPHAKLDQLYAKAYGKVNQFGRS